MTGPAHKPFAFDTVFDDLGAVAYRRCRSGLRTPDEVEQIRAAAFAER